MLKKKIRKLMRDPKLFVHDFILNRKRNYGNVSFTKKHSDHAFTVVTAVHQSEKYLNDYFRALTQQSLEFESHIFLILVDDGSTDRSASIIKEWQTQYPNNISYIYQDHRGVSAARNIGMNYVTTDWVTFIDSDDFVNVNYFSSVADFISTDSHRFALISTDIIYCQENSGLFKHNHPLKYKFAKNKRLSLKLSQLNKEIQPSVSSAFFRASLWDDIRFNEQLTTGFEDADFSTRYLIKQSPDVKIGFVKSASYFYRQREDKTSCLDRAYSNRAYYNHLLENGCLALLEWIHKNNQGEIPLFAQNIVLYHLLGIFKKFLNFKNQPLLLTRKEKEQFLVLLNKIFAYIDVPTIVNFTIDNAKIYYRIAFIEYFKHQTVPFKNVYIEKYDHVKKELLVSYYALSNTLPTFILDNEEVIETVHKIVKYDFFGEVIVREHRCWIPCERAQTFRANMDGHRARLFINNIKLGDVVDIRTIKSMLNTSDEKGADDVWLLMDRDVQADDNAEHFYRYLRKHHPEREYYFALSKNSHDWPRLEKEGFNLVEFGSKKFEALLKYSAKVISSHSYATNYFGKNSLQNDFVFLQHGVIHNDHSEFFNSRSSLSLFITSTVPEYNTLASNDSHYKLTPKEVVLTGLPRHDALLRDYNKNKNEKIMLIMPTWRRDIVGKVASKGLQKNANDAFMLSEYAKKWHEVLNSPVLKAYVDTYGYQVIFAPHAEIEQYLDVFTFPDFVNVWRARDYSIQVLFRKSSFLITDYSSVAFDMAILGKQTIYYQFDKEGFYTHHYRQDYFEYEKDGFGPVVFNSDSLWQAIKRLLDNDAKPEGEYLRRINDTFLFTDLKNSERVYQAVAALG